ncbi:MAG: P63C domain-containing protein [Lachnospiraceae bacterium]|nr:P63C domain-containing protein [Lachnospiraceae bacterium]
MDMPRATHNGMWKINDSTSIECYVMDNGERVLSMRGTARSMGLVGGGSMALVRNLNSLWIAPYLTPELKEWLEKVNRNEAPQYLTKHGGKFIPFSANAFVDLCSAYISAKNDNVLKLESQIAIADKLYAIMTAFAKTGLVAVIDEVTGYQYDREHDELQKLLSAYISEELLPWAKRFPDEFYRQMFRLKKWTYNGKNRPQYVGKLTNHYIYDQLPDGVLEELKQKTPKNKRLHQSLTDEVGVPHLDKQLQKTIALMQASDTWEEFEMLFEKAQSRQEAQENQ